MSDQLPLIEARAVFISDFHLGAAACQAEALTQFLRRVRCDTLYLVGDVIDAYVANRKGKWTQAHNNALRAILTHAKHGTSVVYTPGNHDTFMRRVEGMDFGNLLIQDEIVHLTADGRRYLVLHGDQFDGSVNKSPILPYLGTIINEKLTEVSQRRNAERETNTKPLHYRLKHAVKRVTQRLSSFEDSVTGYAAANDCEGVICGHIHRPAFRAAENGIIYINVGDWTEHCTYLLEDHQGQFHLVVYEYETAHQTLVSGRP